MTKENTNDKLSQKFFLKKLRKYEILISSICILGICICLYALQVEIYKSKDSSYIAYCDISAYISCSRVFTSKYGKGFGLMPENSIFNQPNSIYGLFFFIIQLILLLFRNNKRALVAKVLLSVMANLGNVYLATVLYWLLKDFCIVCVSTYIVNFLLLIFNYKQNKYYSQMRIFVSSTKKTK